MKLLNTYWNIDVITERQHLFNVIPNSYSIHGGLCQIISYYIFRVVMVNYEVTERGGGSRLWLARIVRAYIGYEALHLVV